MNIKIQTFGLIEIEKGTKSLPLDKPVTQMTREENGPLEWDIEGVGGGDCKTGNNLEQPFESIKPTFLLLKAPIVIVDGQQTKLQSLLYYKPLIQNTESLQKRIKIKRKSLSQRKKKKSGNVRRSMKRIQRWKR